MNARLLNALRKYTYDFVKNNGIDVGMSADIIEATDMETKKTVMYLRSKMGAVPGDSQLPEAIYKWMVDAIRRYDKKYNDQVNRDAASTKTRNGLEIVGSEYDKAIDGAENEDDRYEALREAVAKVNDWGVSNPGISSDYSESKKDAGYKIGLDDPCKKLMTDFDPNTGKEVPVYEAGPEGGNKFVYPIFIADRSGHELYVHPYSFNKTFEENVYRLYQRAWTDSSAIDSGNVNVSFNKDKLNEIKDRVLNKVSKLADWNEKLAEVTRSMSAALMGVKRRDGRSEEGFEPIEDIDAGDPNADKFSPEKYIDDFWKKYKAADITPGNAKRFLAAIGNALRKDEDFISYYQKNKAYVETIVNKVQTLPINTTFTKHPNIGSVYSLEKDYSNTASRYRMMDFAYRRMGDAVDKIGFSLSVKKDGDEAFDVSFTFNVGECASTYAKKIENENGKINHTFAFVPTHPMLYSLMEMFDDSIDVSYHFNDASNSTISVTVSGKIFVDGQDGEKTMADLSEMVNHMKTTTFYEELYDKYYSIGRSGFVPGNREVGQAREYNRHRKGRQYEPAFAANVWRAAYYLMQHEGERYLDAQGIGKDTIAKLIQKCRMGGYDESSGFGEWYVYLHELGGKSENEPVKHDEVKDFEPGKSYKRGDVVLYNGEEYECMDGYKGGWDKNKFERLDYVREFTPNDKYYIGDLVAYNGVVYKCVVDEFEGKFNKHTFKPMRIEKFNPNASYKAGEMVFRPDTPAYRSGYIYKCKIPYERGFDPIKFDRLSRNIFGTEINPKDFSSDELHALMTLHRDTEGKVKRATNDDAAEMFNWEDATPIMSIGDVFANQIWNKND